MSPCKLHLGKASAPANASHNKYGRHTHTLSATRIAGSPASTEGFNPCSKGCYALRGAYTVV